MKRSEMLYKLTELMRNNYEIFDDYRDGRLNFNQLESKVTSLFLDAVEEAEMLPPAYKDFQHGNHMDFYEVNEWEPEE